MYQNYYVYENITKMFKLVTIDEKYFNMYLKNG